MNNTNIKTSKDPIEIILEYMGKDMEMWRNAASNNVTAIAVITKEMEHMGKAMVRIEQGQERIHDRIDDHMEEEEGKMKDHIAKIEEVQAFIAEVKAVQGVAIFVLKHWKAFLILSAVTTMILFVFIIPMTQDFIFDVSGGKIDLQYK